jgi:flavin-dependent dehydrogenase
MFDALVADYEVAVEHRCSGAIPIGPPSTVTTRRGFLLGDAAGQTKPFTGGGILYGLRSADHAARVVDPDAPGSLEDYESAWRRDLGWEIRLGKLVRWGYDWPRSLQRLGLRLFEGEIGVHMDEPTSLFSLDQLRAMVR